MRSTKPILFILIIIHLILLSSDHACASSLFSSLKIEGEGIINCLPNTHSYRVNIDSSLAEKYIWEWEVNGGTFIESDNQKLSFTSSDPPSVDIRWHHSTDQRGILSLRVIKKETNATNSPQKIITSVSKTIRLGTPDFIKITCDDPTLSCDGNWFQAETGPLLEKEMVIWNITNGTDENDQQLTTVEKKGELGKRLFIKRSDPTQPLSIEITIQSNCGNHLINPIIKRKTFPPFQPTIQGPQLVKRGQINDFSICNIPDDFTTRWDSDGNILTTENEIIKVEFMETGTGIISFEYQDCQGEYHTINHQVNTIEDPDNMDHFVSKNPDILFNIYPNPVTSGSFTIELIQEQPDQVIAELIRMDGTRVMRKKVKNKTLIIQTDHLTSGLYVLKVRTGTKESISNINIRNGL